MIMNVVYSTTAAQVFEAELAHQRIAPEGALSTVSLATRSGPSTRGEGFVTVEAARMLVAKTLLEAKETVCHADAELLILVAHEIAPDEVPAPGYPRRTADGGLVWACCESTIGPLCNHRLTPGERKILASKQDDGGRWVRRDPDDGDVYGSIPPSQMDGSSAADPSDRVRGGVRGGDHGHRGVDRFAGDRGRRPEGCSPMGTGAGHE